MNSFPACIICMSTKNLFTKLCQLIRIWSPAYGGTSIPRGTQLNDNDGLYYFGDKVCIPKNPSIINQLIYEAHNAQGHPSYERTLANLSKSIWWPRMAKSVKQYCKLCATCQRIKARTTKPLGSLYPLPKPF